LTKGKFIKTEKDFNDFLKMLDRQTIDVETYQEERQLKEKDGLEPPWILIPGYNQYSMAWRMGG